ncbi:hypothetical protein EDB81DRAFT_917168, partial [Dactylonectria macrodidyma]
PPSSSLLRLPSLVFPPSSSLPPPRSRRLSSVADGAFAQCDLQPDGCGQCLRARLRCHGYRNTLDLVFRDETRSTEQKVMARQAWSLASPPSALELGWDIRARYAFFSIYVFGFSRSLAAVVPFYNRAPFIGHLAASVEATSLAFFATYLNKPDLMLLANRSYVIAIQCLSRSLNGLESNGLEEALQSILLLDTYEKIVDRNPRCSSSWMSHAKGGVSLLESNGSQVIVSLASRQLSARLVSALIVGCGAAAVRVPDTLTRLQIRLDPFDCSVKWKFMGILASIVDLQADLHNAAGHYGTDHAKRAWQLDLQLTSLHLGLPPSWRPRHLSPVGDDPLIFGSYYDEFTDHYVAQISNGINAMHLVLSRIMSSHSPSNASSSNINDITRQICAAVPHLILPGAQQSNTIPFSPRQRLQCCTLLAPLYLTSQVSGDALMKTWILRCLNYMSEIGGLKIAQDVANVMRNNPDLDYWSIIAMVGSYAFA